MRNTIRQIYFYAATLIFLIMSVIALMALLNLGLKTYVFTKADTAYAVTCDDTGIKYYSGMPVPAPADANGQPTIKAPTPEEKATQKAECEKNAADQRTAQHQRDLVQYLSMLIVAAPLFFLHFKWVQKEREEEKALAAK